VDAGVQVAQRVIPGHHPQPRATLLVKEPLAGSDSGLMVDDRCEALRAACASPGAESGDVSAASLRAAAGERSSWAPLDELAPGADLTLRADRPVEDLAADLLGVLDQRIGRLGG
jgi:hypothetical protein